MTKQKTSLYDKVSNWLTHQWDEKKDGEKFTKPSQTVPDQSIPLRTMLQRYVNGMPLDGDLINAEPLYLGEESEGIDLRKLDITEIAEYRDKVVAEIQELTRKTTGSAPAPKIVEIEKKEEQEKLINEFENE